MKYILLISAFFVFSGTEAQSVQKINREWLKTIANQKSDTVYIINFWATWCKPCVEELPVFDSIFELYKSQPVKIILVSNDLKRSYATQLPEFIKEKKLKPEVVWMDEPNPNDWIDFVSPNWDGNIPATWIVYPTKGERHDAFVARSVTTEQLIRLLNNSLNIK